MGFPGGSDNKVSACNAGDVGSVSGWRAKIPHTLQTKNQNIIQKQYCSKINKYFKKGPHQKNFFFKKEKKERKE